jgi:hypothetical protein
LAASLVYKPGWLFKVAGPEGRFLCVFANTPDSLRPGDKRVTQHQFEYPAEALADERAWCRWVFDCLLQAERHEAAEFFRFGELRPFWPHHQDEGSPYEHVERWPEC